MEHCIALYAYDVILFCSNLKQSLSALLDLTYYFSSFAGYKIHYSKSVILFMDEKDRLNPPLNTHFMVSHNGFRYLGVNISPTTDKVIPNSHNTLIDKVTQLINRWNNLPIFMIGRINVVKCQFYLNVCICFNLSHLLPHPHSLIHLESFFLTLYIL